MSTLNKSNRKTNSKKQDKSYLQRYKTRNKTGSRTNINDSIEVACIQDQLWNRSDRLFELYNKGQSLQNIRIQQEEGSQIMKNQYMETELLWLEKIGETKHDITTIKENCEKQSKIIKEMEKEMTNKRVKLTQILQKIEAANKEYDDIYIETYQDQIDSLQQEYDQILASGEKIIAEAQAERNTLLEENQQEEKEISEILQEIKELSENQSESYHKKLNKLMDQEQKLKAEIVTMEQQMESISKNIKYLDSIKPIPQENHRSYLQLYEKIYINKQLDLMQELLSKKEKQIQRLEDYEKKKALYKLKKADIQERQKGIEDQKKIIHGLEEEIRQKSTIILDLFQIESQKINR